MKRMTLIFGILFAGYAGACAYLYFTQTHTIFPADKMNVITPENPVEGEQEISYTTTDGTRLVGRIFHPKQADGDVILGFTGNAHNPIGYNRFLHRSFPQKTVVTFFYRGYGPSGGTPSKQAILADAQELYTFIQTTYAAQRMFLVGVSLGSSIAAYTAAANTPDGLFLVVPFDSILSMAQQKYPFFPVKPLLKHNFDTVAALHAVRTPTAVIIAGNDGLIPPQSTQNLLQAIPNKKFEHVEPGVSHGELIRLDRMDVVMRAAFDALQQK